MQHRQHRFALVLATLTVVSAQLMAAPALAQAGGGAAAGASQPKPEAKADPFALHNRWKGLDKDSNEYIVRVTQRSEAENTATIVFDKDGRGQKIWLNLEIKDGKVRVVKATRANGNGRKDADSKPEYRVSIDSSNVLTVSGQGHFDAPKADVKNKIFPLNMTCKPLEAEKPRKGGKGKGKGRGKGKNGGSGDQGD